MHARLRGPNNVLILHQIIKKNEFPSLADEKPKPRPYMNIKVTAVSVSKKFYFTMGDPTLNKLSGHIYRTTSTHCSASVHLSVGAYFSMSKSAATRFMAHVKH